MPHQTSPEPALHADSSIAANASLEMTAKEIDALPTAARLLPQGTRVNITFLAHEDLASRIQAAKEVRRLGLQPVPHISARRLRSESELEDFLAALATVEATEVVFVVGGDPTEPHGPYPDALSVIQSGALQRHGVREVVVAGYPEGHPDIPDQALQQALADKVGAAEGAGLSISIITQFGFDAEAVSSWILGIRRSGINASIRVGVPGPAGVKRLLTFARRFGIAASASKAARYGFSIANLVGKAGPERFVDDLSSQLTTQHGAVGLHLYPFGDIPASSEWLQRHVNNQKKERA